MNGIVNVLRIVQRVEKRTDVLDVQMAVAPDATTATVAQLEAFNAQYDRHNEVACLMLGSMTPELQKQLDFQNPYDMIRELKSMYEKQAGVELFDLIESLHDCKHESGKPVSAHVLKMKSYFEPLERLSYQYLLPIAVGMILKSISKDFEGFVRNYNMHSMSKMIAELHAMLIEYEKNLPKKSETPQVLKWDTGRGIILFI